MAVRDIRGVLPLDNTRRETVAEQEPAYAATSALVLGDAGLNLVDYDQLTGAMTINATVTSLVKWDRVIFLFDTDGTQRIVTFGTNFKSSGTLTIAASKSAIVEGIFDGTDIRITNREVEA